MGEVGPLPEWELPLELAGLLGLGVVLQLAVAPLEAEELLMVEQEPFAWLTKRELSEDGGEVSKKKEVISELRCGVWSIPSCGELFVDASDSWDVYTISVGSTTLAVASL